MKEKRGPGNYVRTMIVVAGLGEKVVRKGADMTHIGTTAQLHKFEFEEEKEGLTYSKTTIFEK